MSITVHRAGVVYSPQYAVLVNPPDPVAAARIRATGGGARAFQWVLNGMDSQGPGEGRQTFEGLVQTLLQQGLSLQTAEELAQRAYERGEVTRETSPGDLRLPLQTRDKAEEEALSLWSAVNSGRLRIADMFTAASTVQLRRLYEIDYSRALVEAKLVNVDLLTNFPVATLAFGYTRGNMLPGQTRLVAFREKGVIRAHGVLTRTEALLFQLDPVAVWNYLASRGASLEPGPNPREARLAILRAVSLPFPMENTPQALGEMLIELLHSYAHRLIRTFAATAGIERDSLAEYLLPHHLSFIIYAAARGEFVLGGLQALFETALSRVINDFVGGEFRCPLDPGCRSGGGACMACLHLGEPSCRWFNRFLDRAALFGDGGFLRT